MEEIYKIAIFNKSTLNVTHEYIGRLRPFELRYLNKFGKFELDDLVSIIENDDIRVSILKKNMTIETYQIMKSHTDIGDILLKILLVRNTPPLDRFITSK